MLCAFFVFKTFGQNPAEEVKRKKKLKVNLWRPELCSKLVNGTLPGA